MNKRLTGILLMPAVYFGLIVMTALLVAADIISEIPTWSLPIFAILAVISAMKLGYVRLLDVVAVFLGSILLFPIGILYLIGSTADIGSSKTTSIIATNMEASEWLMVIAPVAAAIVTYVVLSSIRKNKNLSQC